MLAEEVLDAVRDGKCQVLKLESDMSDFVLLTLYFFVRVEGCDEPAHDIKVLLSLLDQSQYFKNCESCLEQHLASNQLSNCGLWVHILFGALALCLDLKMA